MADVNEDEGWCTDERMVNVSAAKLKKLENLITKEHKFEAHHSGKLCAGSVGGYTLCQRRHYPHIPCPASKGLD